MAYRIVAAMITQIFNMMTVMTTHSLTCEICCQSMQSFSLIADLKLFELIR